MTASSATATHLDPDRSYAVLICDLVGLRFGSDGRPDCSEVRTHIEARGGVFHDGPIIAAGPLARGRIHFFYQPDLSTGPELIAAAGAGDYDAVIAAATVLPAEAIFALGGVRIGAGTGNMGSASWGGGSGEGGTAVLMNTPGINSRATAQMVMKAILRVLPDLDVDRLDARVVAGDFDTGLDLKDFPTEKLEGKTIAILGYGNIGREVAKLARAFGLRIVIHAREHHRRWIENEGFVYASTPRAAAEDADILSVHVGLGPVDGRTGRYANAGLIDGDLLSALKPGAVLVNYDRGELVDTTALDAALSSGRVAHAAIDADLFKDVETGALSGPMAPYLRLAAIHGRKLHLLPHAAADTDHPSRVAGARQAVDQIIDLICHRTVTNLRGTLPDGFRSAGDRMPPGIGPVTRQHLLALTADRAIVGTLADLAAAQHRIWTLIGAAPTEAPQPPSSPNMPKR